MQTAVKTVFAAFEILAQENRENLGTEIIVRIPSRVDGDQLHTASILQEGRCSGGFEYGCFSTL